VQEEVALVYNTPSTLFNTAKFVVELLGTNMEAPMPFIQNYYIEHIYIDGVSLTFRMPRKHSTSGYLLMVEQTEA
jgi:hypothetical protein